MTNLMTNVKGFAANVFNGVKNVVDGVKLALGFKVNRKDCPSTMAAVAVAAFVVKTSEVVVLYSLDWLVFCFTLVLFTTPSWQVALYLFFLFVGVRNLFVKYGNDLQFA